MVYNASVDTEYLPMKQTQTIWNLKIRPKDAPLIERLRRASLIVDQPASQIVRQAIREKLDQLAAEFPQIDATTQQEATVTN